MSQNDRKRYAWGFRWMLPSARHPQGSVQFSNGREYFHITPASLNRLMYIAYTAGCNMNPYAIRFTSQEPSPAQQWFLSASIIRRPADGWKDRY